MKYARFEEFVLTGGGFTNPRSKLEKDKLQELADNIRDRGLRKPLVAWKVGDELVVISGSRRLTAIGMLIDDDAAGELGDKIPYTLFEGSLRDARLEAFAENLHREDLSAFEMATEIYALTEDGLEQKEIATRLSKSQPWVSILLTSFKQAGKALKKAWKAGSLPLNTVYDLSSIEDEKAQAEAVDTQLAAREGGSREDASEARSAARKAAGKTDRPSMKQVQTYRELAEGARDRYCAGMRDAMRFVLGEIGVGEFEKEWFKWMAAREAVADEADGEDE